MTENGFIKKGKAPSLLQDLPAWESFCMLIN